MVQKVTNCYSRYGNKAGCAAFVSISRPNLAFRTGSQLPACRFGHPLKEVLAFFRTAFTPRCMTLSMARRSTGC